MKKLARFLATGLIIAALTFVPALQSNAQVLEEIVVVACKREEPAQDVGISISAFSAEQIRTRGLTTSDALAIHTPGLQATSFSGDPTVMLFAIRGVGQNDFQQLLAQNGVMGGLR